MKPVYARNSVNQYQLLLEQEFDNILVRYPNDFDKCDAIVIPGGESTTMSKQIDANNLRHALKEYSKTNSLFGTCAGMILLSSTKLI